MPRWSIAAFGGTILAGAFLLFQVQPLVSKRILPWFGGCPAVWTTCMLFFQVVLFAGYCYAHLLQQWFAPRRQAVVHLAVVLAGLALLPILPGPHWEPQDASTPTWHILLLLTATVGLPYFALSATSPLVQAWFSGAWPGRSPYRLYALSNAGSLVALLSYPFLFEPAFELRTQSLFWSGLFVLYAALCAASLASVWRCIAKGLGTSVPSEGVQGSWLGVQDSEISNPHIPNLKSPSLKSPGLESPNPKSPNPKSPNPKSPNPKSPNPKSPNPKSPNPKSPNPKSPNLKSPNLQIPKSPNPTWLDRLCWLALPACASLMLLATTNHVCQDVAAVPFLWVIPLSLYLLSFIICFEHARWYVRWMWAAGTVLALAGVVANDFLRTNYPLGLPLEASLSFAALFLACMVCHGELARLKPSPRRLTEFYLMIAAGGALGGFFVSVAAPWIFRTYLEWQVGIIASAVLAIGLLILPRFAGRRGIICYTILAPLIAAGASSYFYWGVNAKPPVDRMRSFFGVVTVTKWKVDENDESDDPEMQLKLVHGNILHGCQFVDPVKRRWPTTYYGETSGVGRAILGLQKVGPVRLGAIGLGVGTLAAYARPGDLFRFYEINPQVIEMAKKHFTYLADCQGRCEIKLGDARLSLEAEPPQEKFNVIVVDAFSGDSIPTHLLTLEAFDIYRKHLAPRGVIAVHVSNRYLRLAPVVRRLAEKCGMGISRIDDAGNESHLQSGSLWVLVSNNPRLLKANPSSPADWGADDFKAPLWTDQYSNLFQILTSPW